MDNLFIKILLGHLVGDFLLQSREMAIRKTEKNWVGFIWCFVHSLIYTLTICFFLQTINPLIIFLIFISHFPIDRWSLANKWLKLIRGRDFFSAYHSKEKYHEIDLIFSCIVYAVADNTIHLILLYLITNLSKII